MANGLKNRLKNWETDNAFEELTVCALIEIIDKLESKGIDWKIWGMFSIPIIVILIDKIM